MQTWASVYMLTSIAMPKHGHSRAGIFLRIGSQLVDRCRECLKLAGEGGELD